MQPEMSLRLVSQAYTSIIADGCSLCWTSGGGFAKGILEQGWQADSTTRMVMPKKPVAGALDVSFNRFIPLSRACPCSTHSQRATVSQTHDYVAFLEN